jgi:hypothetical protein
MAQINLFAVRQTRSLVLSAGDPTSVNLSSLHQGDKVSLSFTLLDLLSRIEYPFHRKVEVSTYSVRLGLFKADGTSLTNILTGGFTADTTENRYVGMLLLNTAALNTAITEAAGDIRNAVLEIEVTDTETGAIWTPYRNTTVTIERDYLSAATEDVAPGEAAATQGFVQGGFFPLFAATPSVRFERSPDGSMWKIGRGNDGIETTEPYTPV